MQKNEKPKREYIRIEETKDKIRINVLNLKLLRQVEGAKHKLSCAKRKTFETLKKIVKNNWQAQNKV